MQRFIDCLLFQFFRHGVTVIVTVSLRGKYEKQNNWLEWDVPLWNIVMCLYYQRLCRRVRSEPLRHTLHLLNSHRELYGQVQSTHLALHLPLSMHGSVFPRRMHVLNSRAFTLYHLLLCEEEQGGGDLPAVTPLGSAFPQEVTYTRLWPDSSVL